MSLKISYSTDLELLAIVDEDDEVVGSKTRREIHQAGLRHRAVHILVFNTQGHVCLQKRSMTKDVNPGAWDTSSAGHVDFGETYETAAKRELEEELGISHRTTSKYHPQANGLAKRIVQTLKRGLHKYSKEKNSRRH